MATFEESEQIDLSLSDGSRWRAEIRLREVTGNPLVQVTLLFMGREITCGDTDYFAALSSVRKQLDREGILLDCYGASRNVWPSPMARDMGGGLKAYRLTLGQRPERHDLVSIFDTGPDVQPVPVDEQKRYYETWKRSLTSSDR